MNHVLSLRQNSIRNLLLLIFAVLTLTTTGCRGVPEYRADLDSAETYQKIANVLPDLGLPVSEPPTVIYLSRSNQVPEAVPEEQLQVFANETGFYIRTNTLIPRRFFIPYESIEDIDFVYSNFPNVLFCFIFPFIQSWKTRLVIDEKFVRELGDTIRDDIRRLKTIAREISLPQPFYFAEELERYLQSCEAEWGANRLVLELRMTRVCPPFIPYAGRNKTVAEWFLWAREEHLKTKPAPK